MVLSHHAPVHLEVELTISVFIQDDERSCLNPAGPSFLHGVFNHPLAAFVIDNGSVQSLKVFSSRSQMPAPTLDLALEGKQVILLISNLKHVPEILHAHITGHDPLS